VVPYSRVSHLDKTTRWWLFSKLERLDNADTNKGYAVESSEYERYHSICDSIFKDEFFHVDGNVNNNLEWEKIKVFLVRLSFVTFTNPILRNYNLMPAFSLYN
jgi:hypothetical protein